MECGSGNSNNDENITKKRNEQPTACVDSDTYCKENAKGTKERVTSKIKENVSIRNR